MNERELLTPQLSYAVWFSQRTGSTLLCKALESTGIAGKPKEWLTVPNSLTLLDHYKSNSYAELQKQLWELGTTPNRVFGVKLSVYEPFFSQIIDAFRILSSNSLSDRTEIWEKTFPNCQHIFMTRRNKIRLAVSWWKAIQSQEWHRQRGTKPTSADLREKYSYVAIDHLFAECCMREAAIQEFFSEGKIVPLTIVYEDFILSYKETIAKILDYLGLNHSNDVPVAPPHFERLADDRSEEWVQRFRRERQKGWKNIGW